MPCYHTPSSRQARLIVLLCHGVVLFGSASVEASLVPRLPKVVLSSSADYPEMVFVVYAIKTYDPWATGIRVDPATAKLFAANTEVDTELEWPQSDQFAVLAVPRALAEKKQTPDPAWLEPSAPGVIRIPEAFDLEWGTRTVVLRYQLEKTDKGPKLTLLNPDDLKAAQEHPAGPSGSVPDSAQSDLSLAQVAVGGLLLVGGMLAGYLIAFWVPVRSWW